MFAAVIITDKCRSQFHYLNYDLLCTSHPGVLLTSLVRQVYSQVFVFFTTVTQQCQYFTLLHLCQFVTIIHLCLWTHQLKDRKCGEK